MRKVFVPVMFLCLTPAVAMADDCSASRYPVLQVDGSGAVTVEGTVRSRMVRHQLNPAIRPWRILVLHLRAPQCIQGVHGEDGSPADYDRVRRIQLVNPPRGLRPGQRVSLSGRLIEESTAWHHEALLMVEPEPVIAAD